MDRVGVVGRLHAKQRVHVELFVGRGVFQPGLSRLSFLQAGAAAGGGLMLSLRLSFGNAEAAGVEVFAPNACIGIERNGQVV
jgi:isoquinoline 1-oxidoreductase subunit beta